VINVNLFGWNPTKDSSTATVYVYIGDITVHNDVNKLRGDISLMSDRRNAQLLSAAIAEQDWSFVDHHLRQINLYYNEAKKGLEWPDV